MSYIIGVDCGGTKTEAIAYDRTGKQLAKKITGFGNLLIDFTKASTNIRKAIQYLLDELGRKNCQQLILGIAGIDSGGLKESFEKEISDWGIPYTLMSDAHLAHYGILKGAEGIILIAGTGSVCFGRNYGNWYRVGGWGHLLGDDGSAFDIAKKAIQNSLAEYDLGHEASKLTIALFKHFEVNNVFELTKTIYTLDKGSIAEAANIVAIYGETDRVAQEILLGAGKLLAESVLKMKNKMPKSSREILVGLNGSVIEKNLIVRKSFFNELNEKESERHFKYIAKEESCAKGAYYYHKRNGEK